MHACRKHTAINEVETACDVSVALDACQNYGLTRRDAERILREVRVAVAQWRSQAASLGIPRSEQELMVSAFDS